MTPVSNTSSSWSNELSGDDHVNFGTNKNCELNPVVCKEDDGDDDDDDDDGGYDFAPAA